MCGLLRSTADLSFLDLYTPTEIFPLTVNNEGFLLSDDEKASVRGIDSQRGSL